jgi:hypothetical protein
MAGGRLVGGQLQDIDPDCGPAPITTIERVEHVLIDTTWQLRIVGADYTCMGVTRHEPAVESMRGALLGIIPHQDGDWLHLGTPWTRFRVQPASGDWTGIHPAKDQP